jgi:hypothetical protein
MNLRFMKHFFRWKKVEVQTKAPFGENFKYRGAVSSFPEEFSHVLFKNLFILMP